MEKVTFLGKDYQVHYNMLAIERIAEDMGVESMDEIGEKMMSGNVIAILKSSRIIAYNGILCGSEVNKTECPFSSAEDLGKEVTKFTDLNPFTKAFTASWIGFFTETEDKTEKKETGAK